MSSYLKKIKEEQSRKLRRNKSKGNAQAIEEEMTLDDMYDQSMSMIKKGKKSNTDSLMDSSISHVKDSKKYIKGFNTSIEMMEGLGAQHQTQQVLKSAGLGLLDQVGMKSFTNGLLDAGKGKNKFSNGKDLIPKDTKLPSKLSKAGKYGKGALKAANYATTLYSGYKAVDQVTEGNENFVKHGADATAGALGIFGGPLGTAFSAGYSGMSLINEATDNAVPDAIYENTILKDWGSERARGEAKGWRASGQLGRMKLDVEKSQDRSFHMLMNRLNELDAITNETISEIRYLQQLTGDDSISSFRATQLPDLSAFTDKNHFHVPFTGSMNKSQTLDKLITEEERREIYLQSLQNYKKILLAKSKTT